MEAQIKLFVTNHNHQKNPSSSLSSSNNLFKSQENNNNIDSSYLEFELEMITLGDEHDCGYTSLKDISPSPELMMMSKKDSWREVPIKDPLVQQAAWAWAYLPSMLPEDRRRSGFIGKLKDGFVECFKNVLVAIVSKISIEDEIIGRETDEEIID